MSGNPDDAPTRAGIWPARLGAAFEGRAPLAAIPALARAAEAGGAGTLWIASHLFLRDPITTALVALQATERLRVALMAMSPYAMHPVHIAMAAAALAELHPGRVVLCLGSGAPADRVAAGIEAPHPLAGLRDAVLMCRGLLAGETVRHEGRVFRLGGQRALVNGGTGGGATVPVVMAASKPRMLRLAGEVADGVLLSAGASEPFVRQCLDIVAEGAAGRPVARIGLVYAAHVAADGVPDAGAREAALAPVRRRLAFILRGEHHAGNLAAAGSVLDQAALMALTQAGDWEGGMRLITDAVVARHAAAGTPAEIAAAVASYRRAGLDEVALAGNEAVDGLADTLRSAAAADGT
ncbi:LLM class flavin-dependent oxidoreductase [Roseomonas sp. NAR14]|uniref:LLM class flavin-dependent oxidoreductase n=1 Tax=Roseomonas acroporae TaxID=2937791 RepID=A0A9X1Y7P5_9PROT|nr:LLM class flavin-dependent oxidoreductase [Roseomonas acroporae]MCK8785689.1 LLM class flavin-dependent oxidoreductase [Roseomonas acroporae]